MMTVAFRNWSYLVLRGISGILFGLLALLFPHQMVTALVLLFGVYALVDGVIAIAYGVASRKERAGMLFVEGAFRVGIAAVTFLWPQVTAQLLLYLIALWAIVTGLLSLGAMAWLRQMGFSGLFLALGGVLSVVLGVAMCFLPEAGMVLLVWLFGGYALVFGSLLVWFGLKLRARRS